MIVNEWNLKISENFLLKIDKIYKEEKVAPNYKSVFKAFEIIKPQDVNVVFIGQDPYPTKGDANGIAFSVNRNEKLPKSLKNIFKELKDDLGIERSNGDLEEISKQGILFLNTILTVEISNAGSHRKIGWQEITEKIIYDISLKGNIIFVLLGNYAQKYESIISDRNVIIKAPHPSPLSAYRGFFGSKIFSRINEELRKQNKLEIDWRKGET